MLDQVGQALPTQGPPLFTGGDLNFHIPDPSPDEMDRARKVFSLLSERSSSCLGCGGPTHNPATGTRGRPRQLDAVSVPSQTMWTWNAHHTWTNGESDHAALITSVTRQRAPSAGIVSPSLLKALPPEALSDLRSRFIALEKIFGVPPSSSQLDPRPGSYRSPIGPGIAPHATPSLDPGDSPSGDHE